MGAVAIQTQCCMQQRDECETDEEEGAPKEKKVLLEPLPWYSRCGPVGAPDGRPAPVPRSVSETTRVP